MSSSTPQNPRVVVINEHMEVIFLPRELREGAVDERGIYYRVVFLWRFRLGSLLM